MIDGFLIKKLVSVFVHLIPGLLILLLLALIARRWVPRLGNAAAILLCLVLIASSVPTVSNYFVANLENRFPVLQSAPEDTSLILVLGSGHTYKPDRPANSVLTASALSRLLEGVRLWKTLPDTRLAVSGAPFRNLISHAQAMKEMAIQLGVPEGKIIMFEQSMDTAAEIRSAMGAMNDTTGILDNAIEPTGAVTGNAAPRLIVVSSATHLLRASKMLDYYGAVYSLAPTDFLASTTPWYQPNSGSTYSMDRAVHEWVGIAWQWLNQN